MPLSYTITFDSGFTINSSYVVIKNINFKYQDINSVEIIIGIFVDAKAFSDGRPEVDQFKHICSGSDFNTYFSNTVLNTADKNPLDQAYQYLLSLPQYSEAILV